MKRFSDLIIEIEEPVQLPLPCFHSYEFSWEGACYRCTKCQHVITAAEVMNHRDTSAMVRVAPGKYRSRLTLGRKY